VESNPTPVLDLHPLPRRVSSAEKTPARGDRSPRYAGREQFQLLMPSFVATAARIAWRAFKRGALSALTATLPADGPPAPDAKCRTF